MYNNYTPSEKIIYINHIIILMYNPKIGTYNMHELIQIIINT